MSVYNSMQVWSASMVFLHLWLFIGCVALIRRAPCWMQQLVMVGLAIGAACLALGFYADYRGRWWSVYAMEAGFAFEHIAVGFLIFRLVFFPNGAKWTASSQRSHSS